MQHLSSRQILKDESLRLGVEAGWYGQKISGTFVAGPFASKDECNKRIAELDPPMLKPKR